MSEHHHYEHPNIDLLPPELIQLRRKLVAEFPTLWSIVGGMLVHDHEHLVPYMNAATEETVTFDVPISVACTRWIAALDRIKTMARSGIILPPTGGMNS